jgi:hypothetical protein
LGSSSLLRRLIVKDLSLLLLKVLPLAILFLISVIEIDVSLNDGLKILNRSVGANNNKLLQAGLLVLDNVKLNDSTLLVEVVKILHFVTVYIIDYGVVERNIGSLKVDLLNCTLNISLVLAVYGNLALIAL